MSSSLVCSSRDNVSVTPVTSFEGEDSGTLIDLWKALKQTSVDVAQSSAATVWEWLESCVMLAQAKKLVAPPPEPKKKPPELGYRDKRKFPWGIVETSWRAPSSLHSTEPEEGSDAGNDLTYIGRDFLERVTELPEDVTDLGPLIQYSYLALKRNDTLKLYHTYLYSRILLFVSAADNSSTPVSPSTPSSSPLYAIGVIHLADVVTAGHVFMLVDSLDAYGIELVVKMSDYGDHRFTLVFPNPRNLLSWSDAFTECIHTGNWSAARGLVSLQNWSSLAISFQDYGVLQQYSVVTLEAGNVPVECGAYLFQEHLLFISTVQPGQYRILRNVSVLDIISIRQTGQFVTLLLEGETPRPWWEDVSYQSASLDLYLALEQRVNARPHVPHSDLLLSKPAVSTWYLAGIVTLSSSPDSEGEYNITVAILPTYRDDSIATHAVAYALEVAFESLGAHRVQARILHSAGSLEAQNVVCRFMHWGFMHEGTRRRVIVDPEDGCWADMSILAMLDMDWALRETKPPPTQTVWDELLARHERERDALHMAQTGVPTSRYSYRDAGWAPSIASNVESSETMSSMSSLEPTLPVSGTRADTGTSSWTIPDETEDVQFASEQIRRWVAQQAVSLNSDGDNESLREV